MPNENTDDQLRAPVISRAIEEELVDHVAEGKTIGKYKIIRLLAEGGMGAVYLAEDNTLGRKIAIKVIKHAAPDADSRRTMESRFEREARGAGRVSHPNVVTIHAYEKIGGQTLISMEYVDGHPLRDELQGGKALKPERVACIVIELLKGLEAIHKAKLIHRDLKPANIMLTRDGDEVRILDLGLVKFAESDDPANDHTVTQAGVPMGTRFYMSPEQINARPEARAIDHRADIYAVGVMCYHLLTGKPPFDGIKSPIFDQHRSDPLPEIVSSYGILSPALKAVVLKAAAKKPDDRYGSAAEMRQALELLLRPPVRKRSVLATLGVAMVLPIVIAMAALVLKFGHVAETKPSVAQARPVEAAGSSYREPSTPPAPPPVAKATAAITVPPPPADELVLTTKAGCQAYENASTSEATAILTKVVAASPKDADALYCLCGSYARSSSLAESERGICESFLKRASSRDRRRLEVKVWLRLPAR